MRARGMGAETPRHRATERIWSGNLYHVFVDIPSNAEIGTRSTRDTLASADKKMQECMSHIIHATGSAGPSVWLLTIAHSCAKVLLSTPGALQLW